MSVGIEPGAKAPAKRIKTGSGSGRPRFPVEERKTLRYTLYTGHEWAVEFEALCEGTGRKPSQIFEEAVALFALIHKHPRPMPPRNGD